LLYRCRGCSRHREASKLDRLIASPQKPQRLRHTYLLGVCKIPWWTAIQVGSCPCRWWNVQRFPASGAHRRYSDARGARRQLLSHHVIFCLRYPCGPQNGNRKRRDMGLGVGQVRDRADATQELKPLDPSVRKFRRYAKRSLLARSNRHRRFDAPAAGGSLVEACTAE